MNKDCEFLAIDILLPKTKPILLGVAYRPPKDNNFYNNLEDTFTNSASFIQQEAYILGDFNTDFLVKKNNSLLNSLKNFLRIFDLSQLIEEPITNVSQTATDLILTSDSNNVTQSGVLPCKISGHNVIFCTRKVSKGMFNKHNVTKIRSMKNYDCNVFLEKLNAIDWFAVINEENVSLAWSKFSNYSTSFLYEVES